MAVDQALIKGAYAANAPKKAAKAMGITQATKAVGKSTEDYFKTLKEREKARIKTEQERWKDYQKQQRKEQEKNLKQFDKHNDEILNKTNSKVGTVKKIILSKIKPNPNQPRHNFNHDTLNELTKSIKEKAL